MSRIAAMMRDIRRDNGKIVFVMGPVAVHTGGTAYFSDIVLATRLRLLPCSMNL